MNQLKYDYNDCYFYAYNMLMRALKADDIDTGISKALYLAKLYLNIDDIIIYKHDTDSNQYVHLFNQSLINNSSELITEVLNKRIDILKKEKEQLFHINKNGIGDLFIMPINKQNFNYIVVINSNKSTKLNEEFMPILKDILNLVLEKYDYISELKKSAIIDTLTGLNNRYVYERDKEKLDNTEGIIYGLFDLFRLKNINDNYSHIHGDSYISKTAKILQTSFPEYTLHIESKGKVKKVDSGNRLYRIGGDEFALISKTKSYEDIQRKADTIKKMVEELDIGVSDPIGINYGIVIGDKNKTLKDLTIEADSLLEKDKRETYKRLGLERRR